MTCNRPNRQAKMPNDIPIMRGEEHGIPFAEIRREDLGEELWLKLILQMAGNDIPLILADDVSEILGGKELEEVDTDRG